MNKEQLDKYDLIADGFTLLPELPDSKADLRAKKLKFRITRLEKLLLKLKNELG
jgi:hypothetical protein